MTRRTHTFFKRTASALFVILMIALTAYSALATWGIVDEDTFTATSESWTGGSLNTTEDSYQSTADWQVLKKDYNINSTWYNETLYFNSTVIAFTDGTTDTHWYVLGDSSDNDYFYLSCTGGFGTNCDLTHYADGAFDGLCNLDITGNFNFTQNTTIGFEVNRSALTYKTYVRNQACREVTVAAFAENDFQEIGVKDSHRTAISFAGLYNWTTGGGGGGGGGASPGNVTVNWSGFVNHGDNLTYNTTFVVSVNATCNGGNCTNVRVHLDPYTPPESPSSTNCGTGPETCQHWHEQWFNDTWDDLVDDTFDTSYSGLAPAAVRWYTTEGTCTTGGAPGGYCQDQLNDGDARCPTRSISGQQFCVATDEQRNVLLAASMTDQQDRFQQLYNFVKLLEHPNAGGLPCWVAYVTGPKDYEDYTDLCQDTNDASDASVTFMGALGIACAKQLQNDWATGGDYDDYCDEYETYGALIWAQDMHEFSNGKWALGGGTSQAANMDDTNAHYPDYYEMQFFLDWANYTGNASLLSDTLTLYETLNHTYADLGVWVPDGKRQRWTTATDFTTYTCSLDQGGNTTCDDPYNYVDNIDTWRHFPAVTLGTTVWTEFVPSYYDTILDNWTGEFLNQYDPTTDNLPFEVYVNTSRGPVRQSENSYKTLAMWIPLAIAKNATWAGAAIDTLVGKYNSGDFDGAAYMGGYYSQFAPRALGIYDGSISPANTYTGWHGATSGGGAAPPSNKGDVSTTPGTTPFWTSNDNPTTCGDMEDGDMCQVNWTVTTLGDVGVTYTFFAYAQSDDSGATMRDTADQNLTVVAGANTTWTLTRVYDDNNNNVTSFNIHFIQSDTNVTNVIPPQSFALEYTSYNVTLRKAGWYNTTHNFTVSSSGGSNVELGPMHNAWIHFQTTQSNLSVRPECTINGEDLVLVGDYTTIPSGTSTLECLASEIYPAFNYTLVKNTSAYNTTINITDYVLRLDFSTPGTNGNIAWTDNAFRDFNQSSGYTNSSDEWVNGSSYVRLLSDITPGPVHVEYNIHDECNGGTNFSTCVRQYYEFVHDTGETHHATLWVFDWDSVNSEGRTYHYTRIVDQANNPVHNAVVTVYRANDTTGAIGDWQMIGQRLTDSDGYTNFYILKGEILKFVATADGYGATYVTGWDSGDEFDIDKGDFTMTLTRGTTKNFMGTLIYGPKYYTDDHRQIAIQLVDVDEPRLYWYTENKYFQREVDWDGGTARIILESDLSTPNYDFEHGDNVTVQILRAAYPWEGGHTCFGCQYLGRLQNVLPNSPINDIIDSMLTYATPVTTLTITYEDIDRQNIFAAYADRQTSTTFAVVMLILLIILAGVTNQLLPDTGFTVFMFGSALLALASPFFYATAFSVAAYYVMRTAFGVTDYG